MLVEDELWARLLLISSTVLTTMKITNLVTLGSYGFHECSIKNLCPESCVGNYLNSCVH